MKGIETKQLQALSQLWNEPGRLLAADVQKQLGRFHRGEIEDVKLPSDPRDESLAQQVLDAVLKLNEEDRWSEARQWFTPAHEPLIPWMNNQELPFVVALGGDEALFRRGSTYQEGHLWHVSGDNLTPLPDQFAAAISPDRRMLAVADAEGIRVHQGWNGPLVAQFPWPQADLMVPDWVPSSLKDQYKVEPPVTSLEHLSVTNSGTLIAIATSSGILVGNAQGERSYWHLALPRHEEPDEWVLEELQNEEPIGFHGDMVHLALSGDGKFLGCGAQDDGHYLFSIKPDGKTSVWAKLGHRSEYPHNACFSDDGTHAAFNSCHFYHGATIAAEIQSVREVTTEPYEEDIRTPVINNYLRVYASTWLPETALPSKKGAFALAGASILTIATPTGEVQSELIFGSSGSGIDYCPATQTLVLSSYSGFLHFLNPSEIDPSGMGWKPPRERKRWCFLKGLPPFQW